MSYGPVAGESVIRQLHPSILLFSAPFHRTGIEIGVRMSAVKLSNHDLILYNPTNLDQETKTALDNFGQVKYIICPNVVHHVFADAYAKVYPASIWIMPETLPAKHPEIKVDYELKDPEHANIEGWNDEAKLAYFPDFTNKEMLLYHTPTKTLFTADMLWNLPPTEQYEKVADKSRQPSKSGALQHYADAHLKTDSWLHKALQWTLSSSSTRFSKWADIIVNHWKPSTIVPVHGDVITTDAEKRLHERFDSATKHHK